MYFKLDEVALRGEAYLTELTWSYRTNRVSCNSHYAVRHPGASEADDLLASIDPAYQPPQRYSSIVIGAAFLSDYDSLPKGTVIYGPSVDQCIALEEYLDAVPGVDRTYVGRIRVMEQELPLSVARGMLESLQAIRGEALGIAS